jgi:hypothetical protein
MPKAEQTTAPASGEANLPAENQPQSRLSRQYERRFESGEELKAFIDERELLRRIPVSRRTAFTWVQNGKLPCVKINRRKLFHWPSVEQALLRQQRNGGETV